MPTFIHQFISEQAEQRPQEIALASGDDTISYGELQAEVLAFAAALGSLGLASQDRVAVWLPKLPETVYAIFGASLAGACFIPVNPLLKPSQVSYILNDCGARVLVTGGRRLQQLEWDLEHCHSLAHIITVGDDAPAEATAADPRQHAWSDLRGHSKGPPPLSESDVAAILYTSGSTGNPKGVVLSHRNLVAGAESVAEYTQLVASDRQLAVLPLSFDAGLSQLTTAFLVGASVVLLDYLLPRDVIQAIGKHRVTGLTAVPPLWNQLARQEWPEEAAASLRFIANTGGTMPVATTRALQTRLPGVAIFLMYGLTEAFRSTYLDPAQVDARPDSIGKAIPNARVLVVNEAGEECGPGEPGELVHCGALVARGYWNNPEATAARFRSPPGQLPELPLAETAVWSGDRVVRDEEGFLYFVSRADHMIKTSGYRVSPTEVEDVALQLEFASDAVALGVPHPDLGQAIVLVMTTGATTMPRKDLERDMLAHCRRELPGFMVPRIVAVVDAMPLNQNGKIDRLGLSEAFGEFFQDPSD